MLWIQIGNTEQHSACKTHDFRLNPLKQGLSFYCGLSFYFWRTMWLYSHSQCIACKMSIFSVITPFVYNIWRIMPKEAAICMRLHELQRMNGKSIIIFFICCLPWLWLEWNSLWWINQMTVKYTKYSRSLKGTNRCSFIK